MKFQSNDVPTSEDSNSPHGEGSENRNLSSAEDIYSGSVCIPSIPRNTNIISSHQESHPQADNDNESTDLHIRLHVPFVKRVIIGSGHILNDLCASLWFSYLLLYFENVVKLSSDYAAYLMLLGQIVDGISTPLIGYEADRSEHCVFCKKGYGRCKNWHLFGVILVTLSFPFIFSPCIGCEGADDWAKLIYYAPFIVIFQIGWASTQISHLALIPKINPDELVRTELLAIRYGFTVASNVTIFVLAWQSFGLSESQEINEDDKFKFRNVAFMAVGIGLVFSILFHIFVKEKSDGEVKKCVALMNAESDENWSRSGSFDSNSIARNIRGRDSRYESDRNQYSEDRRALLSAISESEDTDDISDNHGNGYESPTFHQQHDGTTTTTSNSISKRRGTATTSGESSQGRDEVLIHQPHGLSTKYLSLGKENMSTKDWLMLPQFYVVALVYMATRLSVNVTQVYVPLYLQKSLKLPQESVATVPLTMYCFGFIVAIFIKLINKYIGRQFAYLFGALLTVGGSFLVFLLVNWENNGNTYLIYVAAALLGGGASALLVTSLSITADLIGNNTENGAFVYGAMSFTDKLSCGVAVMLINSMVPCQKDDVAHCTKAEDSQLRPFYRNVLSYASGGFAILGVFGIFLLTLLIFLRHRRHRSLHRQILSDSNESDLIE